MSVQHETLSDYNKLYSVGILPKMEGRYLSGQRINVKMGAKNSLRKPDHSQSMRVQHSLDLQRARARINNQITKVKEERKLKALESRKLIATLSCKPQMDELVNPQTPEKRIHAMEISQIFHSEQAKAKQLNSLTLRRKLRSTSRDYSNSKNQTNSINQNILKRIIKKEESAFLGLKSQAYDIARETDGNQRQSRVETSAVNQLIAEKIDLLTYQIAREEIKLNRPMTIREKPMKKNPISFKKNISSKHKMMVKRNSLEGNVSNWDISTNCSQCVDEYPTITALNQCNKKTSSQIYEDLGNFSDEMDSTKRHQMQKDERIARWV